MKRFTKLIVALIVAQLMLFTAYSQINTGNPSVKFGSKTEYKVGGVQVGLMPTNLPTSGTYGRSQDAAIAYNWWIDNFVEQCSDGSYRVKFDNSYQTVSEGIAYGMLLSVYAGDKVHFDGFWQFYKKSMNNHGVMNWMTDGCNGNARDNGATDAELDAAMALIIASKQWPTSTSPYTYINEARTLIGNIKTWEIHPTTYQTLNGDAWGSGNTCRNPSYQSPAYYREFAKVDVANASFWNNAISAAEDLITANRNSSTGLVGNWCDPNGVSNACAGTTPNEYGSDACRNPWRMATDVLWNGSSVASTGLDVCTKLSNWLKGYEDNLRGPMAQNASNPSQGSYKNGSYTTFALAPMALSSSYQSSLNTCYTNVAGLPHDGAYFNETIRTLTLFVLTGNFWSPDQSNVISAPDFLSATTNDDGTQITVSFTTDMNPPGSGDYSSFSLAINGTTQNGAFTGISALSSTQFLLNVTGGVITPGTTITLSYSSGTIKSTDNISLASFSNKSVKNALVGNSTIIDDCEDNNWINFMGGVWFTYDDSKASDNGTVYPGASTITPLTSENEPFTMTSGGAESSSYSAHITYSLDAGSWIYEPFVGIGVTLDPDSRGDVQVVRDLSGSTGISFWHKGAACYFQPMMDSEAGFHSKSVEAHTDWTFVEIAWSDCLQPDWATPKADFDPSKTLSFQWQIKGADNADKSSGEVWIDNVVLEGFVPVPITGITLTPSAKTLEVDESIQIIPEYSPYTAVYKELDWLSSDPTIATVNDTGLVVAVNTGIVNITATSKKDPDFSGVSVVTVNGPEVLPSSITLNSTSEELHEGETFSFTATVLPTNTTDKSVTWTSSNPSVATVNSSGVVTAVSIGGPVTITATCVADNSVSATATITVVEVPVSGITPSTTDVTLVLGDSELVTVEVLPSNATDKSVTWSSADEGIATVSNGTISSAGVGSTTITVTSVDNPSATATINVTVQGVPVSSVSVDPTTLSLEVGATSSLTETVLPANATQTVTWSSDDESVATVLNGVVTAEGIGTATITVTSTDDITKSATCVVTVTAKLVTSITLNTTTQTVIVGETYQLVQTVLPTDATDKSVSWSSDAETVATVNASGLVTAVAPGTAIITVAANDASGETATATITVENRLITDLALNYTTTDLHIGDNLQLLATITPSNATVTDLDWSSDDASVSVDATGYLTANSLGTAIITVSATDGSGMSATCEVNVVPVLVETISVLPATATVNVGSTQAFSVSVTPSNAADKSVTWSVDDESIATIDASGVLTGVADGSVTVTATAVDGSGITGTATVTVNEVLPTSVVTSTEIGFTVGDPAQDLDATISPANATNKSVTWSSSNTAVATVNADGLVTPVGEGTCTITVSCDAAPTVTATCTVTVASSTTAVTSVSLDITTLPLSIGGTQQLTQTVLPTDATNKSVTWSSSNTAVATVSNGLVTGVSEGTATITVTTVDGSYTATCNVTVSTTKVTDITLNPTSLTLSIDSPAQQVTATVLPANATDPSLTWSSGDANVVTVSSSGVVTVVGLGTTTITATANDGSAVSESINVTVSDISVASVSVNPTTLSLSVTNSDVLLTATVLPANASNKSVTWSSDNESVVTVSASGLVSVVGVGTATITVTTVDGDYTATCSVTVSDVTITNITLVPTTVTLYTNSSSASVIPTITPSDASNKTLSWTSNNESVATVINGVISPVGVGSATVTATATDGSDVSATVSVTVLPVAVTGVTLNQSTMTLTFGGSSKSLVATVAPSDATNKSLTWSSSNNNIATVVNGVVSPVANGTATITVSTVDGGYTATCTVTVSSTVISVSGVTVAPSNVTLQLNQTQQLTATVSPSNASDISVSWSSDNTAVVTVDNNGNLTPVAAGSATVTVTTNDGSFTADATVTVTDVLATSVVTDKNTLAIGINESSQLIATVYPAGADQNVTWASSDNSIATVDASGNVTGIAPGSVDIIATTTDGTNLTSPACVVTVTAVSVTGVTVNPTSVILELGGSSTTLQAQVMPTNAYNQGVSWTVNNSSIATVLNGVVSPVALGKAVVTVITDESGFSAKCSVEVVTKAALTARITEVQAIHAAAVEGTDINQYKVGSKAELLTAISAAITVRDGDTYSQVNINAALADLNAAETYFQKQKIVDKTLIFDAEMGNMTYLKTYVYTYKAGESTIDPLSTDDNPFTTTLGGADGTDSSAYVTGELVNTGAPAYESAGFGFPFKDVQEVFDADKMVTNASELEYDLSSATGISFWHKGESVNFTVMITTLAQEKGFDHGFVVPQHDDWTLVQVLFTDLTQESWVSPKTAFDATKVFKLQWQVKGGVARTYEFGIDEVSVMGTMLDLPSLVEKGTLEQTISNAQNLHDGATEGTANGTYEVGSKAVLQDAIDDATLVLNSQSATQEQVDQATADLLAAVDVFAQALNGEVDKSDLILAIVKAETVEEMATVGTQVGQYPESAYNTFVAAITTAIGVKDNAAASVTQVIDATNTLNAATEAFLASKIGTAIDRTNLETMISTATNLVDLAENGIFAGDYPQWAIEDLKVAIWDASIVYNNGAASQTDINMAYTNLYLAVEEFNATRGMTSVEETTITLDVYPNPVSDVVTVSADITIATISIVSLGGGVVDVIVVDETSTSVNVSSLSVGEYILVIELADGTTTQTNIVKE